MGVPRNEYPRPQMVRENWINLNGEWEFAFDFGRTGKERNMQELEHLDQKIIVPFCPESELSGIGYKDFMGAVWYKRSFQLSEKRDDRRVLLHFEAVDYLCDVWVNGKKVGSHTGGYTPFSFDITSAAVDGENVITVYAEDDSRNPLQPRGKQSEAYYSKACDYTRVTGIWQTVWLEIVPLSYIKKYRCTTDIDNGCVHFEMFMAGSYGEKKLRAQVTYHGKSVGETAVKANGSQVKVTVPLSEIHLWQPLSAELYDVVFTLDCADGSHDVVAGYFGMRSVELGEKAMLINGKPVFQRLVLDQGFYREGIYTAPSDEALKKDIELSIAMGFNGARLHQKVFERRYLYWADQLGYLIWGEYGNWGLDHSNPAALGAMLTPWLESVDRDFNSPALIGWCPFNETWDYSGRQQDNMVLYSIYQATKAVDPTRSVIDTSGNFHVMTDIYDVHDYEQNVEIFAQHYESMKNDGDVYNTFPERQTYQGQPYFVSEYGGILWNNQAENGWGYGAAPKTEEEFADRYVGLARTLMDNPNIFALCYTQLYDVEQEKNGLYTYDRETKFKLSIIERLRSAMLDLAAIEK